MAIDGSSADRRRLVRALAEERVVVDVDARKLKRAARRGAITIDAHGVAELVLESGILVDERVPAAPAARGRRNGLHPAA